MKNILFVASECVPFVKTGGLADVVGALPKNFDKRYFDVRVIIPNYMCMDQKYKDMLRYRTHFYMNFAGKDRYVGVLETKYQGVTYYLIDNEEYFGGPSPYCDYHWDIEKFIYFNKAVLSSLPMIGFKPHIIHCHDWQAGLIPIYLKDSFRAGEFYKNMKSIMTIHNLKFQGNDDRRKIQYCSGLSDYYFTVDKMMAYDDANMLKGGLCYADAITTVSNTYAEEIKTNFYGENLEGLMRARKNDLRGIVNGIDYTEYSPDLDCYIDKKYTPYNFREEKSKNKKALQKQLGLNQDDNAMMIGMVSRLTAQKGFDIVSCIMDELCSKDAVQLVVLGTGEYKYEEMLRYFENKYKGKVVAYIGYSQEIAHKVYAASDAFLMPSLFEPCGLSQLIALKYGTIPIVRETGGLRDTVEPFNEYENKGTGFSFRNYDAYEMLATIRYAESIYFDKRQAWNSMIERAMAKDYSWKASANKYQEMYDWIA